MLYIIEEVPIMNEKVINRIETTVQEVFEKTVTKIVGISFGKKIKTIKVDTDDGTVMRVDIKFPAETTRLQIVAYENNIEVPKVLFEDRRYKYSEWLEGEMICKVKHIDKVFSKSGDLMGRLNKVIDPITGNFLTNSEFSLTNAIWTPDQKVYIVDHGRLVATKDVDFSIVKVLLKRIVKKRHIFLFLETYSNHRRIDNILKIIENKNWKWR